MTSKLVPAFFPTLSKLFATLQKQTAPTHVPSQKLFFNFFNTCFAFTCAFSHTRSQFTLEPSVHTGTTTKYFQLTNMPRTAGTTKNVTTNVEWHEEKSLIKLKLRGRNVPLYSHPKISVQEISEHYNTDKKSVLNKKNSSRAQSTGINT